MTNIEKYLARQTFLPPVFTDPLVEDIGLIITIPAYAEEDLITSLKSLKACDLPSVGVEVVVIINHPVQANEELKTVNQNISKLAQAWAKQNSDSGLNFLISVPIELPKKHAGAGLARKIAMDEATIRLQKSIYDNPIIACFDADATCSANYLVELVKHFKTNPKSLGCSVNFEHPLATEADFLTEGIIQYELHLRYYQAALVFANHPQAEFTVGSSMAVTRNAYIAQGGMNRRKAGEDFWFMLKLMMAGEITAITSSTVFPSSRESFRVPFGTGRAMSEMTEKGDNTFYTASFQNFERLKLLLSRVEDLYENEIEISDALTLRFLERVEWKEIIAEIREYTTDKDSFIKRFYRWFNLFMVMKFFHFLRDEGEVDLPVIGEGLKVLTLLQLPIKMTNGMAVLEKFRAKKRVQPNDYTLQ